MLMECSILFDGEYYEMAGGVTCIDWNRACLFLSLSKQLKMSHIFQLMCLFVRQFSRSFSICFNDHLLMCLIVYLFVQLFRGFLLACLSVCLSVSMIFCWFIFLFVCLFQLFFVGVSFYFLFEFSAFGKIYLFAKELCNVLHQKMMLL